jgi:hypothetical protein
MLAEGKNTRWPKRCWCRPEAAARDNRQFFQGTWGTGENKYIVFFVRHKSINRDMGYLAWVEAYATVDAADSNSAKLELRSIVYSTDTRE